MKKIFLPAVVFLATLGISACSDDSSTSSPGDDSTLAGAFFGASATFQSASTQGGLVSSSLHIFEQSTIDPFCATTGMPWDSDEDNEMQSDHEDYAARVFHCQTSPAGSGPDTLNGAIAIAALVVCSVETAIGTLLFSGEAQDDLDVTIPTDCMTEAMLADSEMSNMEGTSLGEDLVVTLSEVEGDWDFKIQLEDVGLMGDLFDFHIWVKSDDRFFGAHSADGWAFLIDRENGIARFETVNRTNGRHTRFLAEGEINNDQMFESITSMQGVYMELSADSDYDFVKGATISGSPSGYELRSYLKGSSFEESYSDCSDDCTDVEAIEFASEEETEIFADLSHSDYDAWFSTSTPIAPLSFTSVDPSER